MSKKGLEDAAAMQNRCLRTALYSYMEGGPESVDFDRREVSAWIEGATADFISQWGDRFFRWLWDAVEQDAEPAHLAWRKTLRTIGLATLRTAIDRYPGHNGRRYRARVRSESAFFGLLYKSFPDLREEQHGR